MFFNRIETDRLIIREFNEDDFKSIHTYASKPEVTMYLPFGPNSEVDTQVFLKKVIGYQTLSPRYDYELKSGKGDWKITNPKDEIVFKGNVVCEKLQISTIEECDA